MADVSFRDKSRRMALCGVLAALAVVLLSAGAIIPFATFCCPILAMLCMLPAVEEYGGKSAIVLYAAVALLALLMAPDKEAAAIFLFIGFYPIVKPKLDGMRGRWLWKGLLFNSAIGIMYYLLIHLLGMNEIAGEYAEMGFILTAILLVLGNVTFFLLDYTLGMRRKVR